MREVFLVHGVLPGQTLFSEKPDLVNGAFHSGDAVRCACAWCARRGLRTQ